MNGGDAECRGALQIGGRTVALRDPVMVRVYRLLERLGRSDLPVLLLGESGTGKELAAAALHGYSRRRDQRFLALNCGALPRDIIESELFGHERGAFTGAVARRVGLLEGASAGTVFLDEIGDLPLEAQVKLLRALQEQRVRPLGAEEERPIDVRVVAATNKDLEAEVRAGRFRTDLLFRLNAAQVRLPALRERPGDIEPLAELFLRAACARLGRGQMAISAEARACLRGYAWPGNVREVENLMRYLAAVVSEDLLTPEHLPQAAAEAPRPAPAAPAAGRPLQEALDRTERAEILKALAAAGGVRVQAARLLGIPLRTLFHKLAKHDLRGRR